MAEIPLPLDELEQLIGDVAIELLETWASEGRIPDGEEAKYGELAIEDTVFIVNVFMEKFNEAMSKAQLQSIITS
jgi:hypothetical protein